MNILITTIIRNMGYLLLPLSIYLGITVYNYKTIIDSQNDKIQNLSYELTISNNNVKTLRDSLNKQNQAITQLNNEFSYKNDYYNSWLSNSDLSKYGDKANDIFKTKDLDEKLRLIKNFNVKE